jgi:hypothetical protein
MVHLEQPDSQEVLDLLDLLAILVKSDRLVHLDPKALQGLQEPPELTASLEHKVLKDLQDLLDLKEQVDL